MRQQRHPDSLAIQLQDDGLAIARRASVVAKTPSALATLLPDMPSEIRSAANWRPVVGTSSVTGAGRASGKGAFIYRAFLEWEGKERRSHLTGDANGSGRPLAGVSHLLELLL